MADFDTQMAFIRALSAHGLRLYGDMSNEDTRERIRVTIMSRKLENKHFAVGPDHTMETYGQAFERCYRRKVEMRRMQRDPEPHLAEVLKGLEDDDSDET